VDPVRRAAGVEPLITSLPGAPPAHDTPADAFGKHFIRCFFCRIGTRTTEDHFCEPGRELLVAMLDEVYEKEYRR